MFFTFIVSDIEMLFSEVVLFRAYHIINYLAVHLLGRTEVHIVVVWFISLSVDQSHRIYLYQFRLGQSITVYQLNFQEWRFLNQQFTLLFFLLLDKLFLLLQHVLVTFLFFSSLSFRFLLLFPHFFLFLSCYLLCLLLLLAHIISSFLIRILRIILPSRFFFLLFLNHLLLFFRALLLNHRMYWLLAIYFDTLLFMFLTRAPMILLYTPSQH